MNSTFFLFDAARATEANLDKVSAINEHKLLLYNGEMEKALATVAPYVFSFPHSNEFSDFIFQNGWGNSWGILIAADMSLQECFNHFNKFLLVKTEDGEELYFRFYDPRVLKTFLPGCDKNQIIEFFGPVEKFTVEGDTKEMAIEFFHESGVLKQVPVSAEWAFGKPSRHLTNEQLVLPVRKKRNIIDDDLRDAH